MNTQRPAIEMDRFSFALNGRMILEDLTLCVEEGERVCVIGPNGAGKTTLLKCLNRIHAGGTGEIRIGGKPLGAFSHKRLARRLSYVPQADGGMMPYTVSEFVMMGRYPYLSPFSPPGKGDRAALDRSLTMTGTAEFAHRPLPSLSGGERQRVFIAAALAQEAGILLLDEPGTFLDPVNQADIYRLLGRINTENGVTVVSVTHDINMAALTSHRILALREGRMVFWGTPQALMDEQVLREIYGKSFLFARHPRNGNNVVITDVP